MKTLNPSLPLALAATLLSSACSLGPNVDSIRIKVGLPQPDVATGLSSRFALPEALTLNPPTTVDGFDCYAVNVFGQGIGQPGFSQGPGCAYQGITSSLATSNQGAVTVRVPSGPARTIQMIGVNTGGLGCNTSQTLSALTASQAPTTPNSSTPPSFDLKLLGSAIQDLFADAQVTIQNTYSASAGGNFPFVCNTGPAGGTPTGPITLSPAGIYTFISVGTGASFTDNPTTFPPSSSSAVATTPDFADLTNSANVTAHNYSVGSTSYEAVYFVFDLHGLTLTSYTQMQVNVIGAQAGLSSSVGGAVSTGTGGQIKMYNKGNLTWSTATANVPFLSAANVSLIVNSAEFSASSAAYNATGGPGLGPYIVVSMRSSDPAGTPFSTVSLKSVSMTLR